MGYSATIRNELPSHKKIWMNLKYILLNKRSQFEKAKKRSGEVFFFKGQYTKVQEGCVGELEGVVQYSIASEGRINSPRPKEHKERGVTESWRYRTYVERVIFQDPLKKRLNHLLVTLQ